MATTYTATLELECRKQHTCVACVSQYSYVMKRKITGTGGTEEASRQAAQNNLVKAVEEAVDIHACPCCGCLQPEMIASQRQPKHSLSMWIGVIGIGLALILGALHVVTIGMSSLIALVGVAMALGINAATALANPNASPESQRQTSESEVSSGILQIDSKTGFQGDIPSNCGELEGPQKVGLILCAVAALLVLSPPVLALVSGSKTNDSYPAVVGPGESTTIYFAESITAVKGMWNGQVIAKVTNSDDANGLAQIQGVTNNSSWGNSIEGKDVSNSTKAMWATVTIPDDAKLVGKTLNLDLTVMGTYPFREGMGFFNNQGQFHHVASLTVSGAQSGSVYLTSWWAGELLAAVLIFISFACFNANCKALRKRAGATEVKAT
ncbi:MAG: hypothetical protein ACKV2Q_14390 [Planctomycetaceae bacterium]